jgi:hypothetical protein
MVSVTDAVCTTGSFVEMKGLNRVYAWWLLFCYPAPLGKKHLILQRIVCSRFHPKENMSSSDIPIIDIKKTSQNPGAVADELFQACTEWGTLDLTIVPQVSY